MSEIIKPNFNPKGHVYASFHDDKALIEISGDPAGILAMVQIILERVCKIEELNFYDALEVIAKSHHKEQMGD